MIGQTNLIRKIDSFDLSNLPHSILLVGERGSEKHDICTYLANKLNLLEFDMTESISHQFIDEIYSSHTLTLYIVDLSKVTEREQNILLKLFEEPNAYTYLILLSENDDMAIQTIKTRSYILHSDKYEKEVLEPLIEKDKELVLELCSTPGQVMLANHTNMKALDKLCDTFINKLNISAFWNMMTISSKINFKDDYDKFDLYLFIKLLKKKCLQNISLKNSLIIYNHVLELDKKVWPLLNKQQQFEHFLITTWEDVYEH